MVETFVAEKWRVTSSTVTKKNFSVLMYVEQFSETLWFLKSTKIVEHEMRFFS